MADHYDAVIVGSGYGGAIAASRLARARRSVCLLERGREWLPGDFPKTLDEAASEMQVRDGSDLVGSNDGLYEFVVGRDIDVFKGCGLGGTSLVNANVAVCPDQRIFDDPRWPSALRRAEGRLEQRLEEGYARAFQMLGATPYPREAPPKLAALERGAAAVANGRFWRPPINVTFEDACSNRFGVDQPKCTDCGDCVTGCNVGAKNTTAMNYLPDAVRHGAQIFCQVEVQRVVARPGHGGWDVYFEIPDAHRERFADDGDPSIHADVVVLAGGALGSTEILCRSGKAGLALSTRLGEGFTGNGDVLAFGYNEAHEVNGVGAGSRDPAHFDAPIGPCITGIIDARNTERLADGFVIEEGVLPGPLAALYPATFSAAADVVGKNRDHGFVDALRAKGREILSVLSAYRGAMRNTQTFLGMAHDGASGRMALSGDAIAISWSGVGNEPIFRAVNGAMAAVTDANDGTFVRNPEWTDWFGKKLITVHPLGGCAMGEDAERGVVDDRGRVFAGTTGAEVHEGLYVADGAIVPVSVGINPLLTISALAERICGLIAADRGWTIDYAGPGGPLPAVREQPAGVRFTERMAGFFTPGETADYQRGYTLPARAPVDFVLTIQSDDVAAMIRDPQHRGVAVGTVRAPALAPGPLAVIDGDFRLFTQGDEVGMRRMIYRLPLRADDGRCFFLEGFKAIHDDPGPDLWSDTTTLFTTVYDGKDEIARVLGKGILRIDLADFARQLSTIQVVGGSGPEARLGALVDFGRFFAGTLFDTYGGVLAGPHAFDPASPPRRHRALRVPRPTLVPVRTEDGLALRLTRYRGGERGPVLLSHGLGVSSRIFTLDTIETNLVEYLCAHGYDVWALDYRMSIALPTVGARATADDVARYDYPAAVAKVREVTGARAIDVVAHCFGSTTLFMSLLSGLEGVRSVLASQIAAHFVAPARTRIESGLHVPGVLNALGVDDLDAAATVDDPWWDKAFDRALELWPRAADNRCQSATCHRVTFLYSLLYQHDQLSALTHGTLHETFGVANIDAFKHLARLVRAGHLVDAVGGDAYMPYVQRLALPITFIHGADNRCFLPESTERTLDWLKSHNDPALYQRHVIDRYGHIDCIFGARAVEDVYPHVVAHLDRFSGSLAGAAP